MRANNWITLATLVTIIGMSVAAVFFLGSLDAKVDLQTQSLFRIEKRFDAHLMGHSAVRPQDAGIVPDSISFRK